MGDLSLVYDLGDRIAFVMQEVGVPTEDVDVWHGYWVATATQAAVSKGEARTRDICRLEAALRMACYFRTRFLQEAK